MPDTLLAPDHIMTQVAGAAHLGCTVYCWGARDQDRLLVECLGPLARTLRSEARCHRFWFNRFDARGPHIFAVFTVAAATRHAILERITSVLEEYVAAHPSATELGADIMAARHAACRGRSQSITDHQPGMAENNTIILNEHGTLDYPFALSEGMDTENALWEFVTELSLRAIHALTTTRPGTAAAVGWLRAFDRALSAAGQSTADYWRHHACTLMPGLEERLQSGALSLEALFARLGDDNRRALTPLWDAAQVWDPEPQRLVRLLLAQVDKPVGWRMRLMREILHVLCNQLGVPVAVEIPIALFAWQQATQPDAARRGVGA